MAWFERPSSRDMIYAEIGKIVLEHMSSTAKTGPEENAHDVVRDWIIAAIDRPTVDAITEIMGIDMFSWWWTTKHLTNKTPPGPPPSDAGGRTGFLTASNLNPANSVYNPDALDWPLPSELPPRQAHERTQATCNAILSYMGHLSWGLTEETLQYTPEDLGARLARATKRLHEVALALRAFDENMYDELAEQSEAYDAKAGGAASPSDDAEDSPRYEPDDGKPF